jgi:hypothetical protein
VYAQGKRVNGGSKRSGGGGHTMISGGCCTTHDNYSKPISYTGENGPWHRCTRPVKLILFLAVMLGSGSAESASMWEAMVMGAVGCARVAVGWLGGGAWRDSMSKAMVQSHMLLRVGNQ